MKQSRYARGKRNAVAKVYRDDSAEQAVRFRNPFRGDQRQVATAEVSVKSAGLFVGFRMRF